MEKTLKPSSLQNKRHWNIWDFFWIPRCFGQKCCPVHRLNWDSHLDIKWQRLWWRVNLPSFHPDAARMTCVGILDEYISVVSPCNGIEKIEKRRLYTFNDVLAAVHAVVKVMGGGAQPPALIWAPCNSMSPPDWIYKVLFYA